MCDDLKQQVLQGYFGRGEYHNNLAFIYSCFLYFKNMQIQTINNI